MLLIGAPSLPLFAQDQIEEPENEAGSGSGGDNTSLAPAGVTGGFSAINTGCYVDPFTKNFRREIDDVVVPGTVGAYPLKFTRTYNSKEGKWYGLQNPLGSSMGRGWRHSYSTAVGSWHDSAYPNPHTGEGFVFPDGRILPHAGTCTAEPPPLEEKWDETNKIWTLPDGGKLHFGHGFSMSGGVGVAIDSITDPYGQVTTICHDTTCDPHTGATQNRLWKVREPGGKYLEFTYNSSGLIQKVEAKDANGVSMGIWAQYQYQTDHDNQYLNRVDYSDGTYATYTWDFNWDPDGNAGLIVAEDPRLAGPMRHIEYHKDGDNDVDYWGEYKQWTNGSNNTLVTKVKKTGEGQRTEVRGDGATRVFNYSVGYHPCSPGENMPRVLVADDLHGFLNSFTDFNAKTTQITYYAGGNSDRFIRAITDANGNMTEYVRASTSWAITKIIYHPPAHANLTTCGGDSNPCNDPFIEQSFTDTANPFYLESKKARKHLEFPEILLIQPQSTDTATIESNRSLIPTEGTKRSLTIRRVKCSRIDCRMALTKPLNMTRIGNS